MGSMCFSSNVLVKYNEVLKTIRRLRCMNWFLCYNRLFITRSKYVIPRKIFTHLGQGKRRLANNLLIILSIVVIYYRTYIKWYKHIYGLQRCIQFIFIRLFVSSEISKEYFCKLYKNNVFSLVSSRSFFSHITKT